MFLPTGHPARRPLGGHNRPRLRAKIRLYPGWGAVLFGLFGPSWDPYWAFVGFAGGNVLVDGAPGTNNQAEGTALLHVLTWALSIPSFVPITIVSDSALCVRCINGEAKPPCGKARTSVHHLGRFLKQIHEAAGTGLQMCWTRGHCGTAGNECADRVADAFAGRALGACSPVPAAASDLWQHQLLPWAWMLWDHKGLPPLACLASPHYEPSEKPPLSCISAILHDTSLLAGPAAGFVLRLCSANVCSLLHKQQLLAHQLDSHQVSVCGLQETRFGHDSVFQSGGWLCFHSSGQRGHKGCALWVHGGRLAEAAGAPVAPCKDHFSVLQSRVDWLAVRMQWGIMDCVLVVLHAPHSGYSEDARREWWQQASADLSRLGKVAPLVLMGDFNAVVSSFDGPAVGPLAGELSDLSGELAAAAANEVGARFVNTFPSAAFPYKMQPTWKHKCIDYVTVPSVWLHGATQLAHDLDLGNQHDDHTAVLVELHLPRTKTKGKLAPKQHHHVRSRCPSWGCNVHEHAEQLIAHAKKYPRAPQAAISKPYLGSHSISLLAVKKRARRELTDALQAEVKSIMRGAWQLWRGTVGRTTALFPRIGRALIAFREAASELTCSIKQDKQAYISKIADGIRDASSKNEGQEVFRALRFFRPAGKNVKKPFRALPILQDKHGQTATSFEEQQLLRAEHFGDMEAAVRMTATERLQSWPEALVPETGFELAAVPSLLDVEDCARRLPLHKAPGPSGVMNEVWQTDPVGTGRQWFPVFAKAHKRLTEPFRFSTGTCISLYKAKGPQSCLGSFRSVFLLEGLGKGFRKLLRHALVADVASRAPPLFAGCLPGSLTGALTHFLTTHLSLARAAHRTSGILFLDAQSAYYRALRCRITGDTASDSALCHILETMGVDASLTDAVLQWAKGPPLFETLTAHQQRFLQALFRAPAFVLKGLPFLYTTRSGTRPGDGIADVLFAAILVNGLLAVQEQLAVQGIHMPSSQDTPPMPTWADDASLPLTANSPDAFWQVAVTACRTVHCEFGRRALELTYRDDKSALLVSWRGLGSRGSKAKCVAQDKQLEFTGFGKAVQVPLVSTYVHLGTKLVDSGMALPDFRRKLQQASARVKPVAKRVLRRADIAFRRRALILQSIGVSVAQFNVGVWGKLSSEELKVWCSGIDSLYRLLFADDRHTGAPECPSVFEVCGKALLPTPNAIISVERIRHASRLVKNNHIELWELLAAEQAQCDFSWLSALLADLRWVKYWVPDCPLTLEGVEQADTLAVWLHEAGPRAARWAAQAANNQVRSLHQWFLFQKASRARGDFQGVSWVRHRLMGDERIPCPMCDELLSSGSHLAVHAAYAHGHACLSRLYSPGTRCRACLKEHWSITRQRRHLSAGPACLAFLVATIPPLTEEEVAEADATNSLHLRQAKSNGGSDPASRWPVLRTPGPLRPLPADAEAELALAWSNASPFERMALAKSLVNFSGQYCEILSIPVEAESVLSLDRAHTNPLPANPDGRLWIQTVQDLQANRP